MHIPGASALGVLAAEGCSASEKKRTSTAQESQPAGDSSLVTLFLCGDVMAGRGIDQVLPHPSNPGLYESYVQSALVYVELAERVNGPIAKPVEFSYVWGDALEEWERVDPDLRIINLETSVTTSEEPAAKGIHYRMHPKNVPCITAAGTDCCVLANNHVLDWGRGGLLETLDTLESAGIATSGAGRNLGEARAPATMEVAGKGRVLVFAFGVVTSGIPPDWSAGGREPGVNVLLSLSDEAVARIAAEVQARKQPGDIVVVSLHWGGNWGYEIPRHQRAFAHKLVDDAGVDIVHGHSSHHPKGIEVYRGKPILYGCGDFLNDYEGISGHEEYRSELVLMYFVTMDPSSGKLARLEMTPMKIKRFRLNRASEQEAGWLRDRLDRECGKLDGQVTLSSENLLSLGWRE